MIAKNLWRAFAFFALVVSFDTLGQSAIERLTSSEEPAEKAEEQPPRFRVKRPETSLKRHSLGIGLGETVLEGDFKDQGENKIAPDIYYNYSVSHSFDILVNFHYSKHERRTLFSRVMGTAFGVKGRLFQFDAFAPFLIGGLGFYRPQIKKVFDSRLITTDPRITFGHHFGAGVELELNQKYSFAFIGHYHNPYDVKHNVDEERSFDVEGSYIKLLVSAFYIF